MFITDNLQKQLGIGRDLQNLREKDQGEIINFLIGYRNLAAGNPLIGSDSSENLGKRSTEPTKLIRSSLPDCGIEATGEQP
jgi:hypothetical protein